MIKMTNEYEAVSGIIIGKETLMLGETPAQYHVVPLKSHMT
jgi:hypothetical protein